jgi:hypothetical protein
MSTDIEPSAEPSSVPRSVTLSRQLGALYQAWQAGAIDDDHWQSAGLALRDQLYAAARDEAEGLAIGTPIVVAGELIESAWGNQVRTDLLTLVTERNQLGPHYLRFVPPAAADGSGGAWTTIATLGNVPVPSFTNAAYITMHISGLVATTNGLPVYLFRCALGGQDSGLGDAIVAFTTSTTQRERVSFVSYVPTAPSGSQPLIVQVSRIGAGTGVCRVDTNTIFVASVDFRG